MPFAAFKLDRFRIAAGPLEEMRRLHAKIKQLTPEPTGVTSRSVKCGVPTAAPVA